MKPYYNTDIFLDIDTFLDNPLNGFFLPYGMSHSKSSTLGKMTEIGIDFCYHLGATVISPLVCFVGGACYAISKFSFWALPLTIPFAAGLAAITSAVLFIACALGLVTRLLATLASPFLPVDLPEDPPIRVSYPGYPGSIF